MTITTNSDPKKRARVKPKAAPLILYSALLDWLTVTSFEDEFFKYWEKRLNKRVSEIDVKESKVLQYDGYMHALPGGTAFLGTAVQKGTFHYMLRLSGYAAEEHKEPVYSQVRQGYAKATRVDLQVTVEKPGKWSQWDLLCRLKDAGRTTGWVESKSFGDAYETVYVGSRKSERFTRIYVKKSGKTMLLRYETEYKGRRARAVLKALARTETPARFLRHELHKTTRDTKLAELYESCLAGAKPLNIKLSVESSVEKTEGWLIGQVLPAFTRHINDHAASGRALAAFYAACRDAIDVD